MPEASGDRDPLAQPSVVRTSDHQLLCCKSIDKLISDSEEPERRLKKTLGPVSLTALGIGAVIGSGIFTVVGTAIAGQKFDTSSILNAPLLDFLIKHTASHDKPELDAKMGPSTGVVVLHAKAAGKRDEKTDHADGALTPAMRQTWRDKSRREYDQNRRRE